MTNDYIRREDATKVICEWGTRQERIGRYAVTIHELKQNTADMLDELPSADVAPVVHGKWIQQDHNKRIGCATTAVFYYPKCSACGHNGNYDMYYCPNCGAKMDGEECGHVV